MLNLLPPWKRPMTLERPWFKRWRRVIDLTMTEVSRTILDNSMVDDHAAVNVRFQLMDGHDYPISGNAVALAKAMAKSGSEASSR